jgi:hypothetical protein
MQKNRLRFILVDNNGKILGNGIIEKILRKQNKTNIARVKSLICIMKNWLMLEDLLLKRIIPEPLEISPLSFHEK